MFRAAFRLIVAALAVGFSSAAGARAAAAPQLPPATAQAVDFEQDVRPILTASCLGCHGPEKQKSDFRVDVKKIVFAGGVGGEPAVVPGRSAESPLVRYVAGLEEDMQMPPAGKGDPLTPAQIGILRAWIDQGAVWPDHASATVADATDFWSLRPIRRPAVPAAGFKSDNAIDAFLAAKRAEKNLPGSPEADRRTLLRRAAITLTGLPPTPEETEDFIRETDPLAFEKRVDRLLASPRFGERWAQFWLDVVRWSETNGSESNLYRRNAWPYRDYVIRAFNSDLPFDRFIREQIAGDAFGVDEATAFLVSGGFVHAATVGREVPAIRQARADRLDETIQSVSTALLGMTMACARCHNHKFDPIPQKDYYALAAVFQGLEYGHRPWRNQPDAAVQATRAESLRKQLDTVRAELRAVAPAWTEEWPDHLETRFPPVRTRAELHAAMSAAKGIYFPDPEKATAGIHFMNVLKALGLNESMRGQFRAFPNGATAMGEMAKSTESGLIGCTQVTEINYTEGVDLVAVLPAEFELSTDYTLGICTHTQNLQQAQFLADLLSGPVSEAVRRQGGFEF